MTFNQNLMAICDRHSTYFEEVQEALLTIQARQTDALKDFGILEDGSSVTRQPNSPAPPPRETKETNNRERPPREPTPEENLYKEGRPPYHIEKINFPRFSGNDVASRVFSCEHYFEMDETPEEAKLSLAAIHLEGEALQ